MSLSSFDRPYYQEGLYLVGVDEVGRGPLAGPVIAVACHLPASLDMAEIRDSKKLSAPARERIFQLLVANPLVHYSVGRSTPEEIDQINIYRATQMAMMRALGSLKKYPEVILVDAMPLPDAACPVHSIIRGDSQSQAIAAASILAKQIRDREMVSYDSLYPGYGFSKNMGYPTAHHTKALLHLGPTPIHRFSFKPVLEAHLRHTSDSSKTP